MNLKKYVFLLLAAALLLGLSACGDFVSILPGTEFEPVQASAAVSGGEDGPAPFVERPLLSFLNREAFGERYYSDTPVALSYQPILDSDDSRGCRSYVFDRASIIAACDALRGAVVAGPTEAAVVSRAEFILTMADGTEQDFVLGTLEDGSRVLCLASGDYLLRGGDGLWDIAFPAYSDRFDLFDLYFSDAIRAFADRFYEDTPVSVGYRMSSGATITSDDPEIVRRVFQSLAGAAVTVVENYPDRNIDLGQTRDYIFTMADGSYYTFSFAQQCLAVKAIPAFETVYYWMSGLDGLWDIPIASDNGYGRFEGGTVAELRDDIRQTAQVVAGEGGELTVAGVFVEYAIDDQTGYLTLSDETALAFLRTALSVPVTGDVAEAPDGAKITVSVTLSDLTGPILYFTGDSIQQVVGTNYVCDGAAMEGLRSAILQLAADGNNTAEVTEGGTD